MTQTIVMFRDQRHLCPSEGAAFLWLLKAFLTLKPDLFIDSRSAPHIRKGRRGAVYFAPFPNAMNQPARLANGWCAETCLSNHQKIGILDNVAQYLGLKRGSDWDWQAENMPTRKFIDTEALLAQLLLIPASQPRIQPEPRDHLGR